MSLTKFKLTRIWKEGDTSTHIFAGYKDLDRYVEITHNPDSSPEEIHARIIGNEIKATENYLRQFADTFEEL